MRRSKRGPTSLQRMFTALVLATCLIVLLIEMDGFMTEQQPPGYILQRTYLAAECDAKRLGNSMFIYAAVVGIAKRIGVNVLMQQDIRLFKIFNTTADLTSDVEKKIPMHTVYEEYGRRASAFDIQTDKLEAKNTILEGYFQSWKYFRDATEEVRKQFSFLPHIKLIAEEFMQNNRPSQWDGLDFIRVGIHVRRGDVIEEYYKHYGYTTADALYYQNCMKYFKDRFPRVQFIVCSDDIGWAKDNIKGDFVIYSENHDYEDLAILSMCNHSIISVGSFGWWSAWLANGTTLYYEKWPKEFSKLEYHVDKKSYFPPSWIPMT